MTTEATLSVLGQRAVRYATEKALEVFPCHPKTKEPLVSQKQATTVVATIVAWWSMWPDALIGHRIDVAHLILDTDPRHGGDRTWAALEEAFGPIAGARRHHSGRGDGGHHDWYLRPAGHLSVKALNEWAKVRGVGAPAGTKGLRWTAGIDLLRHEHRYTILPPSPHPATGEAYGWDAGGDPAEMNPGLAALLTVPEDEPPEPDVEAAGSNGQAGSGVPIDEMLHGDSIADWFTETRRWRDVLGPHGWTLAEGDGDSDGSKWRHPDADPDHRYSASVRHGCLFVHSDSTDFEQTEEGDPHGYKRFRAFAVLEHEGDLKAAASAARALKVGTKEPPAGGDPPPEGDDGMVTLINWAEPVEPVDAIVEGLVVPGMWTAIPAPAKAGKSTLLVSMTLELAAGREPFSGSPIEPVTVLYADGEMGRDNLEELVRDCGFDPRLLDRWHATPDRPRLDTKEGAQRLLRRVDQLGARVVVLDGLNGFVDPEKPESDDTPWRAMFALAVIPLKERGVAVVSGDNLGKDPTRGARGSSVKADKPDAVVRLRRTKTGVRLYAPDRRGRAFAELLDLDVFGIEGDRPIHYRRAVEFWSAATRDAANLLDRLGVPLDEGRRKVIGRLRILATEAEADGRDPAEYRVRTEVLASAIRYRKVRP